MIVVTGASGFIGSCMVGRLNQAGLSHDLMVVDDFYKDYKEVNLLKKDIREWVHRDIFLGFFERIASQVSFVFHLGARTDTVETDQSIFDELNLNYSKKVWEICTKNEIPLIYASSAATYGDGQLGYKDEGLDFIKKLKPLNEYGRSKNNFDIWALSQKESPPYWAGLKFFNVYGPNEYHKKRMASVIFHAVKQIRKTGALKLFKSHNSDFKDGEQSRDFVYVKDVIEVCYFLFENKVESGLYNVGTGTARTFLDLGKSVFKALDLEPNISFIDTPEDIRANYQYYTQADIKKIKSVGYKTPFHKLEKGVEDYVKNYLLTHHNYY